MIRGRDFVAAAAERGLTFWTGVPCSFLNPLYNAMVAGPGVGYVPSTSEGEAVAIAAGAYLAGAGSGVMFQNSGLGNAVNPLTSLTWPFRIPVLVVVTWRGQPGIGDEPQHELMGQITAGALDLMRIEHRDFPDSEDKIGPVLDWATALMRERHLPAAFVMRKGDVADQEYIAQPLREDSPPTIVHDLRERSARPPRFDAILAILDCCSPSAAIIATTGKCGRELFTAADRPQHLYLVGSMGGASALGLGVALNSRKPVIVLDGDGAALMKLGNVATIGSCRPNSLIHIVFDNGVHDSTGGQATVSQSVSFRDVAAACSYATASVVDSLSGLRTAVVEAAASDGPHMIHAHIAPGSIAKLGRPTIAPRDVAQRFMEFLRP